MKTLFRTVVLVLTILTTSCATTLYDHYTFTETLEAKAQTHGLIKLSESPFSEHVTEVALLKNRLDKMVAYERSKSKNPITIKMWEFLNKEDSSIHKFLKLWEEKGALSPALTEEFSKQTDEIFQLMIDYETKKDTESENALSRILGIL